jgi:hypothetical protein
VITVDCREVEHLKHEMAVFVSDWVGAIPNMKIHEFILSPIENEMLDKERVVNAIREFFASVGETGNYAILPKNDYIMIRALHDRPQEKAKPVQSLFSCVHCGYVTPYEVLWQNHMKMHYL